MAPFEFSLTRLLGGFHGYPPVRFMVLAVSAGILAMHSGCAAPAKLEVDTGPTPLPWKPLFDGKTLDGWHVQGTQAWRVENGEIVGELVEKSPYSYLVTNEKFSDFELKLQMLYESQKGNSGVFFRSDFPGWKNKDKKGNILPYEKRRHIIGPQAEFAPPRHNTGRIYDAAVGKWASPELTEVQHLMHRFGEWNTMRITAIGNYVTVYLNGYLIADLRDYKFPREGVIALQLHAGGEMKVRFKDIQIRPAGGIFE